MWNKKSSDPEDTAVRPDPMPVEPTLSPRRPHREGATIGPSIRIKGDVTGEEDLTVQGEVEGTVTLKQNNVTVGKDGRIKANVHARVIEIEGRVEGDLHGDEQVVVRKSGVIRGNVIAPRVTLEDGCKFKGSIDMDVATESSKAPEKLSGLKPADKPAAKQEKRGPEWKAESQASGS